MWQMKPTLEGRAATSSASILPVILTLEKVR